MYFTLYFISLLHAISKKSVWNFCFLKLFGSLVRNENNIKRLGFYTLQVTMVFSNFPRKQLKQNKEYVWILWSSWTMICLNWRSEIVIKKPYCEYVFFFRFLRLFSSTVVPTIQRQPPKVFFNTGVLKNFANFTGKHQLYLINLQLRI